VTVRSSAEALKFGIDCGEAEQGGVERATYPVREFVVVNVCGIGESFEQLCVTSGPTAILGRARVLAVEAHGVLQAMRKPGQLLDDDFVVP